MKAEAPHPGPLPIRSAGSANAEREKAPPKKDPRTFIGWALKAFID